MIVAFHDYREGCSYQLLIASLDRRKWCKGWLDASSMLSGKGYVGQNQKNLDG